MSQLGTEIEGTTTSETRCGVRRSVGDFPDIDCGTRKHPTKSTTFTLQKQLWKWVVHTVSRGTWSSNRPRSSIFHFNDCCFRKGRSRKPCLNGRRTDN